MDIGGEDRFERLRFQVAAKLLRDKGIAKARSGASEGTLASHSPRRSGSFTASVFTVCTKRAPL